MKKKGLIIIGIIVALLIAVGLVTSYIDMARVRNSIEPKFTIKIVTDNGNKVTYWGLGYKVVRYTNVSPNVPYKNNSGVKYGNWFMKYEPENKIKISLEQVNDFIINYLMKDSDSIKNIASNYIDTKINKVVVGLVDNTKEKQDEFITNVFSNCCGSEYIKYIKENEIIEFRESKDVFDATIIVVEDDYMTVEVIKDSKAFKKNDKVTMKITRPTSGINDFYVVGNNVRITFNGNVEYSNPPQIGTVKIELIS